MTRRRRLVIVGASLSGLRAAEGARKAGFDGDIVLIGAESRLPYDRPPLSKAVLAGEESLLLRDTAHFIETLDVEVRLNAHATGLDPDAGIVWVDSVPLEFDTLVIATGAVPRRAAPWHDELDVYVLRTDEDALRLRAALEGARAITIIGAGFIGAEVASAASKAGLDVTIVEAAPTPLQRALGVTMGRQISALHERNGVSLRLGVTVISLERDANGRLEKVVLSDGVEVQSDMVLVAIGATPNTRWLTDSGIALSDDGAVLCESTLRSVSHPRIFAAGDVARRRRSEDHSDTERLENWTSANDQGFTAGRNAVSENLIPFDTVPYVWSDWYGHRIQMAGNTAGDEVSIVMGAPDQDRFVALYASGATLVGALAMNEPALIMKLRRQISDGVSWDSALEFVAEVAARRENASRVNSG
ncbi:FAD-dependent oxidoreductase [Microbacterium sp. NPDC077644]|uniref:NAD(P)/FAD-dependent oxidoreductase n=1 Tax=Microbacterium sp. NPDC077644 TaxID=3155055 RepID=UPI00344D1AE8